MSAAAPFIESTFAAARRHLQAARVAQENALIWGRGIYQAGYLGRTARRMTKMWSDKRAMWIGEAMAERQRAKLLRLAHATTDRPSGLRLVRE